jgi:hypothetical protein
MTDTAAPAATTQTATPAANSAPAASATPAPAADAPKQDSGTPAPKADAQAGDQPKKDSGEEAPAQGADQPDTDKAEQPSQSSDDKDPKDTDKKDAEGKDKEDGSQEAQPAYEPFTVPEGMELDADALNEALPVLQELKADQATAQKLVDVASSMLSKAAKKMTDQHNAIVEGWRQETIGLFGKEGDAKFQESVGRAEEVVKHFFSEEQRNVLTHYGLGNHPAFFAMCMAIAEGTGEDRPTLPSAGNGAKGQKTLGQIWYPDSQT